MMFLIYLMIAGLIGSFGFCLGYTVGRKDNIDDWCSRCSRYKEDEEDDKP